MIFRNYPEKKSRTKFRDTKRFAFSLGGFVFVCQLKG